MNIFGNVTSRECGFWLPVYSSFVCIMKRRHHSLRSGDIVPKVQTELGKSF